jgi:hypothetical protein
MFNLIAVLLTLVLNDAFPDGKHVEFDKPTEKNTSDWNIALENLELLDLETDAFVVEGKGIDARVQDDELIEKEFMFVYSENSRRDVQRVVTYSNWITPPSSHNEDFAISPFAGQPAIQKVRHGLPSQDILRELKDEKRVSIFEDDSLVYRKSNFKDVKNSAVKRIKLSCVLNPFVAWYATREWLSWGKTVFYTGLSGLHRGELTGYAEVGVYKIYRVYYELDANNKQATGSISYIYFRDNLPVLVEKRYGNRRDDLAKRFKFYSRTTCVWGDVGDRKLPIEISGTDGAAGDHFVCKLNWKVGQDVGEEFFEEASLGKHAVSSAAYLNDVLENRRPIFGNER